MEARKHVKKMGEWVIMYSKEEEEYEAFYIEGDKVIHYCSNSKLVIFSE